MKHSYKILAGVAAMVLVFGYTRDAKALGTTAATVINNTAVVSGANFTKSTQLATLSVATQIGGRAIGSVDAPTPAGRYVTNSIRLTNYGNLASPFKLSFVTGTTAGAPGAGWSNGFGAGKTNVMRIGPLAPGAGVVALYRVLVPFTAGNNSIRSWAITASNTNAYSAGTALSAYVGDNTTNYGAEMGRSNAPAKTVAVSGATGQTNTASPYSRNYTWAVAVSAAVVAMTKSVASVTNAALGANRNVPGSTVTYKITLTNTGGASATNIELRDTIPANTAYRTGTLRSGNTKTNTYYSAGALSDTTLNDEGAAAGNYVEFTPGGNYADTTPGNVGASSLIPTTARSYFFRVTIN